VPVDNPVPGEWLSPTQPFPVGMATVAPQKIGPDDAWGFTPVDRWMCKKLISSLRHGPIYTPQSLQGTIMQPSPDGGPDWGGGAYDPASHVMVVPTDRVPFVLTTLPRDKEAEERAKLKPGRITYIFKNGDAPYATKIQPLLSPLGAPCTPPPWAALTAVDLSTGAIKWEVTLGDIEKETPLIPIPLELGSPGVGGPLVTAGGLIFIGFTNDDKFRAFDLATGKKLWTARVPAAAMATPVTYEVNGEQYVVITAGGHSMFGAAKGDAVVAYKLKQAPKAQ
jgi:quinoprotein glucose dehydrogenase